jgi:hypothetical protein
VHHRCITRTAFGGLPRNRGPTGSRMVKPNLPTMRALARRIRLTGLLRKTPAHVGVFYRSFAGRLVLVAATACRGAISLEPLGAGAGPFAWRLCRLRSTPRLEGTSRGRWPQGASAALQRLLQGLRGCHGRPSSALCVSTSSTPAQRADLLDRACVRLAVAARRWAHLLERCRLRSEQAVVLDEVRHRHDAQFAREEPADGE